MEKIFLKFESFYKTLSFCFKISWKASKKYSLIRFSIEIINVIIPFCLIILSKYIINFFVLISTKEANIKKNMHQLIVLLSVLLTFSIIGKIVMIVKEYCVGVHSDLIKKNIETQIAQKSSDLDLSYFDSTKYYNEIISTKNDSNALQTLNWLVVERKRRNSYIS